MKYIFPFALLAVLAFDAAPPAAKKEPVIDTYHGVKVVDDYRWLEDWDSPDVKAWSQAQNKYARSVLDKLPGIDTLRKELTKILTAKTTSRNASRAVAAVTPALIADNTAISAFHSEAEKLVLVMDNLNTHKLASLYVTFPPEQARRIAKRLEIHVHAQARIVVDRGRDRVERVESSVPEPADRVDRRTAERGRIVGRDAERDSSDIRPR